MQNFHLAKSADLDRLCDVAGRLNLPQLPLFRAAADGLLNLFRVESPDTAWPARMIERVGSFPVCFMIAGDPGYGHPDYQPDAWACAQRLRYWAAGAIIHGAAGAVQHYREAVAATVLLRRLALVECSSAAAVPWTDYLRCTRRTLTIMPEHGPHPVPEPVGSVH